MASDSLKISNDFDRSVVSNLQLNDSLSLYEATQFDDRKKFPDRKTVAKKKPTLTVHQVKFISLCFYAVMFRFKARTVCFAERHWAEYELALPVDVEFIQPISFTVY